MSGHQLIRDYPHRLAGHCGSGALRDLVEWAGLRYGSVPLGEGEVFGFGGELGFSYLRSSVLNPPIYLVGRGVDLTGNFAKRMGIKATPRSTDDPEEGWAWVREELDRGLPVLCWADIGELPYLRVRMRMSRHDIVIVGYDDPRREAIVVDNDRAEPQVVSYDALRRARASTAFPGPTRHTTYQLQFPGQLPRILPTAADACRGAVRGMRRPDDVLFRGIIEDDQSVVASGLDGISTFVEDLSHWHAVFEPEQLDAALLSLTVFIDKAGTGGGLFRQLQSEFLAGLARRTGLRIAERAAAAYARLADRWSAVAAAAGNTDTDPVRRLAETTELATDLPTLEEGAVRKLEALGRTARAVAESDGPRHIRWTAEGEYSVH